MKICNSHWTELREAMHARGLDHLIAANGRDAASRMVADIEQRSEAADFDPLMYAHNLLWERSMRDFGLGIMMADEAGNEYCPVCELLKHTPAPPDGHRYPTNDLYFIAGPADAALAIAKDLKLWPASSELPPADAGRETGDVTP